MKPFTYKDKINLNSSLYSRNQIKMIKQLNTKIYIYIKYM